MPERDALICVRRPRSGTDRAAPDSRAQRPRPRWAARPNTKPIARASSAAVAASIGRRRCLPPPRCRTPPGPVLDPIVSLRQSVRIPPGGTARIAFTTGFADTEERRAAADREVPRPARRGARARPGEHPQPDRAAPPRAHHRRDDAVPAPGRPADVRRSAAARRRCGAAEHARPGRAVEIRHLRRPADPARCGSRTTTRLALLRDLLKAHEYLRRKGLAFDLVVLNEHASSYLQDLQNTLLQMVEGGPEQGWVDRPGGVFLRRADLMPPEDRTLLEAAARVVMDGADGNLREQLKRPQIPFGPEPGQIPEVPAAPADAAGSAADSARSCATSRCSTALGGFADERARIRHRRRSGRGRAPAQPWSNVVAHPTFGFVADRVRSRLHVVAQQPRQPADAVEKRSGQRSAGRGASSFATRRPGEFWSATPLPAGGGRPYTVRHGQGYSTFDHTRDGLASTLLLFVPPTDAVKIFHLTLRNDSSRAAARTRVTLYVEWVLGENRSRSQLHVVTSRDRTRERVLGAQRVPPGVCAARRVPRSVPWRHAKTVTGDRTEFLGRNGKLARPAAMRRASLSNRTGPALDPCGAIQVVVTLEPSETRTLVGLLGDAVDAEEARAPGARSTASRGPWTTRWRRRSGFWDRLLGTLVVKTPDRSLDLMLNRWLAVSEPWPAASGADRRSTSRAARSVSATSCRTCSRCCFRRRDLRAHHLLHAASRQFVEGDVQHWWHEPGGQGVRTRFSDDRLWLVYATLQYVAATGDDIRARRAGDVPRRPPARARRTRGLRTSVGLAGTSLAVRALRARRGGEPRHWRARAAADRHRRLERRHEPGRRRRPR